MIKLNIDNVTLERLGEDHGIDLLREYKAYSNRLDKLSSNLTARRKDPNDFLGWIDLPNINPAAKEILDYVAQLDKNFTDLVVLGIGGSSLGALTVITALQHPYRHLQQNGRGLRVNFVDNVDPDTIKGLQEVLDPRTTLVNVISKSGTTAETMSAYLAFQKWLQNGLGEAYKKHMVATTDPKQGILRPLAEREGYETFTVPPTVGGRFSVLSAVGLLPIALAGIDIEELLAGAAEANAIVETSISENPIKQSALVQYLAYRRGKIISVLMPYSTRLRYLPNWYVQLWAESLGKKENNEGSLVYEGSTPLAALGATDQHSQVQLFNEGPNNKIFTFVRIAEFDNETIIPTVSEDLAKLKYLSGQTFNKLINAEQAATAFAITSHRRPNYTITLDKLDAYHLGLLLQYLEWQTALMGELMNINTYNQPGVELGKVYTYALMGREGFEKERKALKEAGVV